MTTPDAQQTPDTLDTPTAAELVQIVHNPAADPDARIRATFEALLRVVEFERDATAERLAAIESRLVRLESRPVGVVE